jgi:hypothetical protein
MAADHDWITANPLPEQRRVSEKIAINATLIEQITNPLLH